MNSRAGQSGFTLVEMLIALAIVGLSFAVLLKIISDDLDRTRRARDDAIAVARLQSLLAAQVDAQNPSLSSGKFGDGSTWRVVVAPSSIPGSDWPVSAVTVAATVTWHEGATALSRTLTTLRVVPKKTSAP